MSTVGKRMKEFKKDLLRWKDYDYVVINDNLEELNCNVVDFSLDYERVINNIFFIETASLGVFSVI